jgi:hypothetical protein
MSCGVCNIVREITKDVRMEPSRRRTEVKEEEAGKWRLNVPLENIRFCPACGRDIYGDVEKISAFPDEAIMSEIVRRFREYRIDKMNLEAQRELMLRAMKNKGG